MIKIIEVTHGNIEKCFQTDELDKAKTHAKALELLGYKVQIAYLDIGLYENRRILLYTSPIENIEVSNGR